MVYGGVFTVQKRDVLPTITRTCPMKKGMLRFIGGFLAILIKNTSNWHSGMNFQKSRIQHLIRP